MNNIQSEATLRREFTNEYGVSLKVILTGDEVMISMRDPGSDSPVYRLSWAEWEKLVGDINLVRYIARSAQKEAQSEGDVQFVTLDPELNS